MPLWLSNILEESSSFMPHGHCYLWLPGLLWLHVASDFLIGAAYLSISVVLYALVRSIRLPFRPMFIAFGLFIGLCGLTHFMEIWNVWQPDYLAAGLLKAATAVASVVTAVGMVLVRPQVEALVGAARLSEERRVALESAHAELQALYTRVSELDQAKTQFFANISHELRTPLTLILGPAERLLQDPGLTPVQRTQVQVISRNSKNLLKQVNDLLDIARLEAAKMDVRRVRLDVALWFRDLAAQFDVLAAQRQIAFRIEAPEHLLADTDPDMLERLLVNLLANAFKFTPEHGQVVAQLQAGPTELVLCVADTGPGVAADQQEAIFQRFHQVDDSAGGRGLGKHSGTGLGLAIAREYVQLHGGTLGVASVPGQGATFTARLPLHAPGSAELATSTDSLPPLPVDAVAPRGPALELALDIALQRAQGADAASDATTRLADDTSTAAQGRSADDSRPSVLVVEDNREMREFVASTLAASCAVVTAADGEQGLEQALALRPDLVVTDLMMPRMDGEQLVGALRARPEFDSLPVMLLTARNDDALRVKLLASGAQDYLSKPFLPQELVARARNLVAMKRVGDTLRAELQGASGDIEGLAQALALKHRQLQTALDMAEVAREQAERASQVKSQFLGMVSHELRTPLSTIQLNAQLLARASRTAASTAAAEATAATALTATTALAATSASTTPAAPGTSATPATPPDPRLERLSRAARQMSELVEGLLHYIRTESTQVSTRLESCDLAALARDVVEAHADSTPPAVRLSLAPLPPHPLPLLRTDPRLLRVVMSNLVSNALKFTAQGHVTVRLEHTPHGHVVEVADSGVGIAPDDLARIFLPFEQVEAMQRKSIPGVGLGLALVRQIVSTLGGRVELTSALDSGSTFKIVLPHDPDGAAIR